MWSSFKNKAWRSVSAHSRSIVWSHFEFYVCLQLLLPDSSVMLCWCLRKLGRNVFSFKPMNPFRGAVDFRGRAGWRLIQGSTVQSQFVTVCQSFTGQHTDLRLFLMASWYVCERLCEWLIIETSLLHVAGDENHFEWSVEQKSAL